MLKEQLTADEHPQEVEGEWLTKCESPNNVYTCFV